VCVGWEWHCHWATVAASVASQLVDPQQGMINVFCVLCYGVKQSVASLIVSTR